MCGDLEGVKYVQGDTDVDRDPESLVQSKSLVQSLIDVGEAEQITITQLHDLANQTLTDLSNFHISSSLARVTLTELVVHLWKTRDDQDYNGTWIACSVTAY